MILPASQPTMAPMIKKPIRCISEPPVRFVGRRRGALNLLTRRPRLLPERCRARPLYMHARGDLALVVQVRRRNVARGLVLGPQHSQQGRDPRALLDRIGA